jgi:hypothetical protein
LEELLVDALVGEEVARVLAEKSGSGELGAVRRPRPARKPATA